MNGSMKGRPTGSWSGKEDCIEYEAEEQHAWKVWSGCGLRSMSKGLDRPSVREAKELRDLAAIHLT